MDILDQGLSLVGVVSGLRPFTLYYVSVRANNTVGSVVSMVNNFTTGETGELALQYPNTTNSDVSQSPLPMSVWCEVYALRYVGSGGSHCCRLVLLMCIVSNLMLCTTVD